MDIASVVIFFLATALTSDLANYYWTRCAIIGVQFYLTSLSTPFTVSPRFILENHGKHPHLLTTRRHSLTHTKLKPCYRLAQHEINNSPSFLSSDNL